MKIKISYLLLAVALVIVSACTKEKSRSEMVNEFRAELTAADSLEMVRMCDDCMKLLQDGRLEEALSSMYEYDEESESIQPLSEEAYRTYLRKFQMFPVLDYTMEYFSFQLGECNDVKYKVKFAEGDGTGANPDAYIGFMFNPIKIDGRWYLSVKRGDQDIDKSRQ